MGSSHRSPICGYTPQIGDPDVMSGRWWCGNGFDTRETVGDVILYYYSICSTSSVFFFWKDVLWVTVHNLTRG
jgi:hypothetical protein